MTRYFTLEGAKQLFDQSGEKMVPMPPYSLELECFELSGNEKPPTIGLQGRLAFRGHASIYQLMLKAEQAQKILSELYAKEGFTRTRDGAEAFAAFIRKGDAIPGLEELLHEGTAVYEPMMFDEDWGSWFQITYVPVFEKTN